MFRGKGDTSYICPWCDAPFAENVFADKIWDIVVRCHSCDKASEFHRLPIGSTAQGYIFFPVGTFWFDGTLDPAETLIIGVGAITDASGNQDGQH